MTQPAPAERRLVRDLMKVGVPTCTPATSIHEIARMLLDLNLDEVIVLEEGHNVGAVGREELVRAYAQATEVGSTDSGLTAEDVMRPGVLQIPPDLPLSTAVQIMRDHGVRTAYLTHHAGGVQFPAAYLSYDHLIRHLAVQAGEDLSDLGTRASRHPPLETFIQRRDEARRRLRKK